MQALHLADERDLGASEFGGDVRDRPAFNDV
jgi:hypothetical protein